MTDVLGKCLTLAFSLMILGQAYWVRRIVGTWLFPACLFGLFWFAFTFFPLAILFWVPVQPYGVAFIFFCTLAFSLASLPFDWNTAFQKNKQKRETTSLVYGSTFLRRVFYLTTLSSVLFLVLNLFAQGFSLDDLLSNLYATATAYNQLESLDVPIYMRLGVVCAYLGAILGGLVFSSVPSKKKRRLIVVLSFLPSAFIAVTQSSKWALFLCVTFFCAGLLLYRLSAGTLYLFKKANVKPLILCALILILIATASFMSRGLYTIDDNKDMANALVEHYASYCCGHVYAFSDWFSFRIGTHAGLNYIHEGITFGYYTFAALFRAMGSHKVVPDGIFDDYYSHGDLLLGNIFTMFRGLVTDFGIAGSLLFMIVLGYFLHMAFHAMLRNPRPVFTVAVFIFSLGYFYSSFVISMLVWGNIYLTFALLWAVLQINKRILQTGVLRLAIPGTARELALRP
jgi:oligosaccharide repeat unit polymerase